MSDGRDSGESGGAASRLVRDTTGGGARRGVVERAVDFLIIGAPKAGTTSLFEYMREHPQVHMPSSKEIAFFLDGRYERGLGWYLDRVASGADGSALRGEASVRYMAGTPRFNADDAANGEPVGAGREEAAAPEAVIPLRIKKALPGVKLICLLRDPVARCISEYRMAVLTGLEQRPFERAVGDLLAADEAERARVDSNETNCYVAHGEYGRILAPFVEAFGRDRLLALESEDLSTDPQRALETVFSFLSVRSDYVPPNLGVRYREGSDERRARALDPQRIAGSLRRFETVRGAWRALPESLKDCVLSAAYRLDLWNRRASGPASEGPARPARPDAATVARLRDHYRRDGELLTEVLGQAPSWL